MMTHQSLDSQPEKPHFCQEASKMQTCVDVEEKDRDTEKGRPRQGSTMMRKKEKAKQSTTRTSNSAQGDLATTAYCATRKTNHTTP